MTNEADQTALLATLREVNAEQAALIVDIVPGLEVALAQVLEHLAALRKLMEVEK